VSRSSDARPPSFRRGRLSKHDRSMIAQAHQLAEASGPAAVRSFFGTNDVSSADSAHAYAEALNRTTWVIGELLAIIARLVDAEAGITLDRE